MFLLFTLAFGFVEIIVWVRGGGSVWVHGGGSVSVSVSSSSLSLSLSVFNINGRVVLVLVVAMVGLVVCCLGCCGRFWSQW